jgi:hypothetical protein
MRWSRLNAWISCIVAVNVGAKIIYIYIYVCTVYSRGQERRKLRFWLTPGELYAHMLLLCLYTWVGLLVTDNL